MTPQEERNQKLAERMIKNLNRLTWKLSTVLLVKKQ